MIEAQQSTIPTLPDLMAQIEQRFAAGATAGVIDAELAGAVAGAFTEGTNGDLFPLMAYSRGCHAAAEVFRERGNADRAALFHAMGQDFLAQAIDALGALAALDVHLSGTVRH